MAYTVKQLSKLSGVTVRTLHFYEEIGLLMPAYYGSNGYRYYEERELLQLQQILFFKELGFTLKQIQKVVGKSDFDQLAALYSHRKFLRLECEKRMELLKTVEKTIKHLKGTKKMKDHEIYHGFSNVKQADYEQYLINRFGDSVKEQLETSKKKMKSWSKAEWDQFSSEWDTICKEMAKLLERNLPAETAEVQKVIRQHFKWIPWSGTNCTREAYIGLGQGYTGYEWKETFKPYDPEHPKLAQFLAEGMRVFAERELS